jgi:hypothetical protein
VESRVLEVVKVGMSGMVEVSEVMGTGVSEVARLKVSGEVGVSVLVKVVVSEASSVTGMIVDSAKSLAVVSLFLEVLVLLIVKSVFWNVWVVVVSTGEMLMIAVDRIVAPYVVVIVLLSVVDIDVAEGLAGGLTEYLPGVTKGKIKICLQFFLDIFAEDKLILNTSKLLH